MAHDEMDVAYRLLDLDLVDSEGRRCGKVDDFELDGGPGEATHLGQILTGAGPAIGRLPAWLRAPASRLFGDHVTRVSWDNVDDFDSAVHLTVPAKELGLGAGDARAAAIVSRIPGAS